MMGYCLLLLPNQVFANKYSSYLPDYFFKATFVVYSQMKILIGTPIHQMKDYAMQRWLENVSKLQLEYPADLLLVDNSPGTGYMEKVRDYCKKCGVKNYKIIHIEFNQEISVGEKYQRIDRAQEAIRQEFLVHDYDAWFSWESDVIIPVDALDKLIQLMQAGDFIIVAHNCWMRGVPDCFDIDMGCTLIKGSALKRHRCHCIGEDICFEERVYRSGGNYAYIWGVISPIYHLIE